MSDAYAEGGGFEPRGSPRHGTGKRPGLLRRYHLAVRAFLSVALLAVAAAVAFESLDLSEPLESLANLPVE